MHGLSPLCWRVVASRPRCRRLERSHLAAIEPRKDASDADTIATCSDPHAGEAITLRDLERVPNAFRRDQESPRVFPKLDEVKVDDTYKKVGIGALLGILVHKLF